MYEFDFGSKFVPRFEKYPRDQPFNWYYNDYTDKKELNKQVMSAYVKELSPFEPHPEPDKYPLLHIDKATQPRWYKYELESRIMRRHQYSIIPYKHSSVDIKRTDEHISHLPYQQKDV